MTTIRSSLARRRATALHLRLAFSAPRHGETTPAYGRSRDDLCKAFMTFINRGDLDGAIGPGVALVDKFGSANCDAKLVATLANLLLNRNESGDAERAVAMIEELMADFPPEMRDRRHQNTYDYARALMATQQWAKSFETCMAIAPTTPRHAAEAAEIKMEALENLRQFIEEENQYAEPKNPANLELAVTVSRELLKLRDGAIEHLNLGAQLCIKGDVEEGMRHYELAKKKQDEPESKGGTDATDKERLRKNLANGRATLEGKPSPDEVKIIGGAAMRINMTPDGRIIGEPTIMRFPTPGEEQ